jgi:hypothetical protein
MHALKGIRTHGLSAATETGGRNKEAENVYSYKYT